jgi:hypothetical protein
MITRDFAMEPGVTPLATPLAFILQAIALGVPVLLAGLLLLFYRRMGGASSTDFNEETPEETAQVG